jgi:hypothetical protein
MVEKMKCQKCGLMVCHPCVSSNAPAPEPKRRVVIVASDRALLRTSHFHRLALATRELGLSRREIPNWIADVILNFKGDILTSGGAPFEPCEVDEAFGDDGSFRWLSDFLRFAEVPSKQCPQKRILPRLRLIDLAFRIAYPDRAALIGK